MCLADAHRMQSFTPCAYAAATETAFVTKPAPTFTADAVVNGEFRKVSLSDYKGTAPRLGPRNWPTLTRC